MPSLVREVSVGYSGRARAFWRIAVVMVVRPGTRNKYPENLHVDSTFENSTSQWRDRERAPS